MDPVFPPKQATDVVVVVSPMLAAGCVIIADVVAVQPLASLTVTVYVPAINPEISCVTPPFDQAYV